MRVHLGIGVLGHQRIALGLVRRDRGRVQRAQLRIGLEGRQRAFECGQIAPDRQILPGGIVAFAPIGVVEGAVFAIHIAPVVLHQIAVERAQRVMVERREIPRASGGELADAARIVGHQELARHRAARPVGPGRVVMRLHPLVKEGPVRAVILQRKILPDQGFDLDRAFAAPQVGIVAAGELRDHRAVDVIVHAVIGEELEGQRDRTGIAAGLDQRGDRVIAHMDVQELVHIGNPDPVRGLDHALMRGVLERLHLVIAPLGGVGQVDDAAARLKRIEQRIGPVGAIVGIEQEIRNAQQTMERHPFQQERALVLHACHRGYPHDRAPSSLPFIRLILARSAAPV